MAQYGTPLNRQIILRTAVDVADNRGLGQVTMRKLASRLGVEAMSLYHHVNNKDDLLDGMVDLVFGEIDLPVPGDEWQSAMDRRAHSVRTVLTRHHWALGLVESRTNPGPVALRHHDAMLGTLRTAGFTVAQAAHAYAVLDSFIYGFVLQELSMPFRGSEETATVAKSIVSRISASEYPYLVELTRDHVLQPGYDFGDEFGRGLTLILDGLGRIVG